jgi:hypothetical protein
MISDMSFRTLIFVSTMAAAVHGKKYYLDKYVVETVDSPTGNALLGYEEFKCRWLLKRV